MFELLVDPVYKLPASDDPAIDEIPGAIPEPVEFTECKATLLLRFNWAAVDCFPLPSILPPVSASLLKGPVPFFVILLNEYQ